MGQLGILISRDDIRRGNLGTVRAGALKDALALRAEVHVAADTLSAARGHASSCVRQDPEFWVGDRYNFQSPTPDISQAEVEFINRPGGPLEVGDWAFVDVTHPLPDGKKVNLHAYREACAAGAVRCVIGGIIARIGAALYNHHCQGIGTALGNAGARIASDSAVEERCSRLAVDPTYIDTVGENDTSARAVFLANGDVWFCADAIAGPGHGGPRAGEYVLFCTEEPD